MGRDVYLFMQCVNIINIHVTECHQKTQNLIFKMFFKQGAKVHRLVKAPGGYFSNAEIEQVGIRSLKLF